MKSEIIRVGQIGINFLLEAVDTNWRFFADA